MKENEKIFNVSYERIKANKYLRRKSYKIIRAKDSEEAKKIFISLYNGDAIITEVEESKGFYI